MGSDVFVLEQSELGLLPAAERPYFRPAIMNPSIVDGQIQVKYHVFYPYTKDLPDIATEQVLQERLPTYYSEYLYPAKATLSARRSLKESQPQLVGPLATPSLANRAATEDSIQVLRWRPFLRLRCDG